MPPPDLFDARYAAANTEPVEPPGGRELLQRAPAVEPFALHGCVLTPDEVLDDGYVVVGHDSTIATVQGSKPGGTMVHDTDGIILPGLLDLHGHPEFNVFAAWEPPKQFANRYAWRQSDVYHQLVRDPQNKLLAELEPQTELRYAEVRALVGGVTAIQGASGKVRTQEESLVRNVDLSIFGEHRGRSMVDLPSGSRGADQLASVLAGIQSGDVKAFYVHLAEGRADNERSVKELDELVSLHALTPATVIIHGTALSRDQLGDVKDAGAKLVWSPQSNLRLYGETTRAADALDLGLPLALGADWLPSGSPSLLAEMQVARRALAEQGGPTDAKRLVRMVTRDAAKIAGLDDKLGLLAAGRPADVVVLERRDADPWESVLMSDPSAVELVMIDGDLAYGRADWIGKLADPSHHDRLEQVIAWGRPMVIDTSYAAHPGQDPPPTLAELRAALVGAYPAVGPIFA